MFYITELLFVRFHSNNPVQDDLKCMFVGNFLFNIFISIRNLLLNNHNPINGVAFVFYKQTITNIYNVFLLLEIGWRSIDHFSDVFYCRVVR